MKLAAIIWIVGSILTIALVVWLWKHRRPVVAAEVILISPFPCPPGIPC